MSYRTGLRRRARALGRSVRASVATAGRRLSVGRAIRGAPGRLPPGGVELPVSTRRTDLETLLTEHMVPFWYPRVIDPAGGYRLNHGPDGTWLGPGPKNSIAQARQAWFFARLARSPYGNEDHLEAARHGMTFIWDRQRDHIHGGFYWEVDHPVDPPDRAHKSLLTQAYVLYAISEYGLASRDEWASARAAEHFGMIEEKARDRRHGGFHEFLTRDWKQPARSVASYHDGNDPSHKTFGTQLHLLEALLPYVALTGDPLGRECLGELLRFVEEHMILRPIMVGSTVHRRDGRPILGSPQTQAYYGHDLELVWLVLEARALLGEEVDPLPEHRGLFANAFLHGEDPAGGLYLMGPIGGVARARRKVWWVQAEALICALSLHCLTGDAAYAAAFHRTLDWILDHQVDRVVGDWHTCVMPDGTAEGEKAGPWRTAYHNGRAVLECLSRLDQLDATGASE